MAKSIVQNSSSKNQQVFISKDGDTKMQERAFNQYLDNLIRENHTSTDGCYSLFACDLSYEDKKIFLSYLVTPNDFADLTSTANRERVSIDDYEEEMQYFIDQRIDEIWHEDMQERGGSLSHCNQTGQAYYR